MTVHAFQPHPEPSIPSFEGKEVHTTKVKFVSPAGLDIDNAVFFMDDIACMKVELRCIGINHVVNAKGEIERVQTVKVLEAGLVDFDPAAKDGGIFRG